MRTVHEKAKWHAVYPHSDLENVFVVESGSSGNLYKVQKYSNGLIHYCNCKWEQENPDGHSCSHIIAVRNYVVRKNVFDSLPETVKVVSAGEGRRVEVRPDGTVVVWFG